MRALLSTAPGGPETLALSELPDPVAGPGELLVRVRAAAINYPDVLIIEDKYQMRPPRPFAPGGEIAGEVEAVGEGVAGWKVGDRLIAVPGFGGLAEKIVIPAKAAFALPGEPQLRRRRGAAADLCDLDPRVVRPRQSLRAGETLLVLGAAGGVGLAAIELGKARGRAGDRRGVERGQGAGGARGRGRRRRSSIRAGRSTRTRQKALAEQFKAAVGPGGRRRHLRSGRRRLCRAGAALDRLGRALSGRRFPRGNPEAAAQPDLAQELRRVRGVLGRVRGARSQGQCGACREPVPAVGRRARSGRGSARPIRSSAAARRLPRWRRAA